jgi:hypothetical protein
MKKLSSPFDLIKKAVNIFSKKENLIYLAKIYSPVAFFTVLSIVQTFLPSSVVTSKSPLLVIVMTLIQILYLLTNVFVAASGVIALRNIVDGKELLVKKTFKSAWKIYWAFLLFSIVIFLIYLFGFVLLIVPGVLFVVWFAFSRFIIIEKGLKIKESLLKSKEMVKGIYWKILGRLIIFGAFMILLEIILSIVPYGVGAIATSLCGGLFMLPVYLLYREISG